MQRDSTVTARRILIADSDREFAHRLSNLLGDHGYQTAIAATLDDLFKAVAEFQPGVAICEAQFFPIEIPLQSDGCPKPIYVGMVRGADMQLALRTIRQGAADFFDKDCPFDEIVAILDRCFATSELQKSDDIGFEMLWRAKEAAEEASRTKSEFLATVSHELRTPLNAIIGFSELMIEGILGPIGNPHYRSYIDDIHESGRHLLDLINDILDYTKVEAGKLDLHESEVEISQMVVALMRQMGPRAREAGLELANHVPEGLPRLWCDRRKLKQMLLNLLSNAVKFTLFGGKIEVEASCDDTGFLILVRDSGIGISESDLARVLQPFVQADNKLSRTHEGTGLGLTLVDAMAKLHGGTLRLESKVGEGTTAMIHFPHQRVRFPSAEFKNAATG